MLSKEELAYLHVKEVTFLASIITVVFVYVSYTIGNMEFLYYGLVVSPFLIFFYLSYKQLQLTTNIVILSLLVLVFHLFGTFGAYQMTFYGLHYDTILHLFGSFVIAILAYNFLKAHWKKVPQVGNTYLFLTVLLVSLGVGALVEMIEFGGVLAFNSPGVGDYFNNAMDLTVNGLGATVGAMYMIYSHH